jgi:putative selenate reductase FAD-binding subunit
MGLPAAGLANLTFRNIRWCARRNGAAGQEAPWHLPSSGRARYNRIMITDILRPRTVREAVRAKARPNAAYLGGGTWLNSRRSDTPTILISLENLGLAAIEPSGDRCAAGAMVTLQQVVDHPSVPQALRDAASLTASRTLRNMKTIGGELGLWSPGSAILPALLALDAEVLLAGRKKPVSLAEARAAAGDLILGIVVAGASRISAVRATSRTSHSGASVVAAVSGCAVRPSLADVRVVLSDCQGQLVRLNAVEEALNGSPLPPKEQIEGMISRAFTPAADMHGSVEYKRYMAGVLAANAFHALTDGEATA